MRQTGVEYLIGTKMVVLKMGWACSEWVQNMEWAYAVTCEKRRVTELYVPVKKITYKK